MSEKIKDFYKSSNTVSESLVTGIKLFGITSIVCLTLFFVNFFTKDIITERNQQAINSAISVIMGEGSSAEEMTSLSLPSGIKKAYMISWTDNVDVAYCYSVTVSGYGGDIEMLIGISDDGAVLGVEIISASETPGIGSKALTEAFLDKFTYKKYPVSVDSNITPVAGATVTSRAITDGVNLALQFYEDFKGGFTDE